MNSKFLIFLGLGIAVVAAGIAFTWVGSKGAHLALEGKILKVRTLATDQKNSILVVDFRVHNDSDTPFVVREGVVKVKTADGNELEGRTIARTDINRVFEYHKILGLKYNEALIIRDRVLGRQNLDRMLAAQFEVPASDLDQRKGLTLTLTDLDGPVFTFSESK